MEAAIASTGPLWFPGLAAVLAAGIVDAAGYSWVSTDYGTGRWLAQNPAVPREIAARVEAAGTNIIVERLAEPVQRRFPHLHFADNGLPDAVEPLNEAISLLARLPGINELVTSLVKAVHILRAKAGYDISHSDPGLPFSIFLSIPGAAETAQTPRLAETLLHESLHLQLTLIEAAVPLVADGAGGGYSPWQGRSRPLSGLLHGLYVFAGISDALRQLAGLDPQLSSYAARRRWEITAEVATLGPPLAGLTPAGASVWARAATAATDGIASGPRCRTHF